MKEVTKVINNLRKMNKNQWYSITLLDEKNNLIEVKGFNTWLQVFRINRINNPSHMDISVNDFINHIERALK
jgi:hypothetical protein